TPDINLYAELTCNPTHGLRPHQFLNPNCFALPGPGQTGDGRLPYMAGPIFWNNNRTLRKSSKIPQRQKLEFRVPAFNFLNHDLLSFTNGDNNLKLNFSKGTLSNATDTKHVCAGLECQAFGFADYRYGHRILEVGAKYSF